MATTQTSARSKISLPANARNTRAAIKAGEAAPARAPRAPSATAKLNKAEKVWVEVLHGASGFHRDAFAIELAVGLAVFVQKADAEKVTLDAKRALNSVYADAGYACATPVNEDYKTVNRRINVTADLFIKLGARAELLALMGETAAPADQVAKLTALVKTLKFSGPNDVLAYCGKPVAVKRPRNATGGGAGGIGGTGAGGGEGHEPTQTERQISDSMDKAMAYSKLLESLPPGRVLSAGPITVPLPFEASYSNVMEIANMLVAFAKTQMPQPAPETAKAAAPAAAEA